ncbi:Valine--tRNA ligase, chloroplastic/mitochondrial 2 [Vitis vinifera]|uniref:valine--tRNA ligase n=1 Tax=Vitis vinifera TaxID=29760 RepID=A0A438CKX8_VITVI|nr:Valine--tRNA ligase, chloroplastic/mitochondrial 2 [Vitis vinifera]
MSKTLGNVIDPIDTIKEFGTDALRFTLALGTAGQDLNLSTERLTSNKAFTNKLWNAGKFVLQNLPSQSDISAWETILACKFDKEEALLRLPLPECWVVSKLHCLIDMVTTSYDKYFFGDVGRETYDFFWGDFADCLFVSPHAEMELHVREGAREHAMRPHSCTCIVLKGSRRTKAQTSPGA